MAREKKNVHKVEMTEGAERGVRMIFWTNLLIQDFSCTP